MRGQQTCPSYMYTMFVLKYRSLRQYISLQYVREMKCFFNLIFTIERVKPKVKSSFLYTRNRFTPTTLPLKSAARTSYNSVN